MGFKRLRPSDYVPAIFETQQFSRLINFRDMHFAQFGNLRSLLNNLTYALSPNSQASLTSTQLNYDHAKCNDWAKLRCRQPEKPYPAST